MSISTVRSLKAPTVEEQNPSVGMKLLADIREVFGDDHHLETATLPTCRFFELWEQTSE